LLALIRKVFNFAAGQLDYAGENPARHVQRFPERSRERYLRPDEAERFFAALATMSQDVQDYVLVALFTGARRANVLGMRWADVDLTATSWTIPGAQSKNAQAIVLPLVAEVLTILRRRRAADPEAEYVFASWGEYGFLTEPKRAWRELCRKAALVDLHFHDLRRSLGSWQAAAGVSLPMIGRSLGHKSLQTTLVYSRLDLSGVRASVQGAVRAMKRAGRPRKAKGGGA
jgi:integrase